MLNHNEYLDSKFNAKPGLFGTRFKIAIQEVPAGYANEAQQIIEEAREAGVYPELPPLTMVGLNFNQSLFNLLSTKSFQTLV